MWQATHGTRAWGPFWYAVNSGCITVWHTCPQNCGESMYSTPRNAASEMTMMLTKVRKTSTAAMFRVWDRFRSRTGHTTTAAAFARSSRRRAR